MRYIQPALALILGSTTLSHADVVPINSPNSSYFQNFDTLSGSGSSSTIPMGWKFLETGTSADSLYNANSGSNTGGNTYSYGTTGSEDRALGTLRSGSLVSRIGVTFQNNTDVPITAFELSYSGEQWRSGTADRTDRLEFSYNKNSEALDSVSFVALAGLNFNSVNNSSVGALDGNLAENRVSISGIISGFTLAPGETITFRWSDFDSASADDGLAIDNVSFTAVPEPQSWMLMLVGSTLAALRLRRKA